MSSTRVASSAMASTSTLDDDVLMSKEHKEILREHREQLVDNMYPDDLLNQLQSARVLSHREASRIKERQSAEAMNENLLDTLIRKPDRAFSELINALRESDQNHVANIIDKNKESTPKQRRDSRNKHHADDGDNIPTPGTSRKRKVGEIGVRLQTDSVEFDEDDEEGGDINQRKRVTRRDTEQLEEEREQLKQELDIKVLSIIKKELRNLDTVISSGISESSLAKRRVVMETLKDLQKYRREIASVDYGSILFRVVCPTLAALVDLRELCSGPRLPSLMSQLLSSEDLKSRHLKAVRFSVSIDSAEYQQCSRELEEKERLQTSKETDKNVGHGEASTTRPLPHEYHQTDEKDAVLSDTEDLCLVKYISLSSPPHKPASLEDPTIPQIAAEEALPWLSSARTTHVLSGKRSLEDVLQQRGFSRSPRGRSPIRHVSRRTLGQLNSSRKSLSLSPVPSRPMSPAHTKRSRSLMSGSPSHDEHTKQLKLKSSLPSGLT